MSQPPRPSPPMNTATTAAEAAVEAPKTRRNSRVHAVWYASAQAPETKSSGATSATGTGREVAAISIGLCEIDLSGGVLAAADACPRHRRALDRHHAHG